MNRLMVAAAVLAAATITACASDTETVSNAVVERGGELYQTNCASCHGTDLAGAPDWKTPNEDGSYPAPPHDSSGHTWHHSDRLLIEIIRDGSNAPQTRMPAFGDQLTDDDIEAILEFIKASWGPQEKDYQSQVTEQEETRS
ncbi:MAG: cytochrome c [Acidimicrobiia bacterium]